MADIKKKILREGTKKSCLGFERSGNQLSEIESAGAIDEIRQNRLLIPDNKDNQDQRGERKGSLSGNDKIFGGKRRLQESISLLCNEKDGVSSGFGKAISGSSSKDEAHPSFTGNG